MGLNSLWDATLRVCLRFGPAQFTVVFTIHFSGCPVSSFCARPVFRCLFLIVMTCADCRRQQRRSCLTRWLQVRMRKLNPGPPDFSVDPKTLYEAASAVPVPDGANVVELVEDESYTFDDSGRMNHVGRIIYKVLTQKGAEELGLSFSGWEPWHEARPVIRARVIGPDFTVHDLDPNTVTEAPARGGDYKTYSDGKRLRAPFPAIAPGVVVEEEYTETETAAVCAGPRGARGTWPGRCDGGAQQGGIRRPASLPLRTEPFLLARCEAHAHGKRRSRDSDFRCGADRWRRFARAVSAAGCGAFSHHRLRDRRIVAERSGSELRKDRR
jgi:hypothetical protein